MAKKTKTQRQVAVNHLTALSRKLNACSPEVKALAEIVGRAQNLETQIDDSIDGYLWLSLSNMLQAMDDLRRKLANYS